MRPPTGKPNPRTGALKGRGRGVSASSTSDWQAWWTLNRWAFFPERGAQWVEPSAVVTPTPGSDAPIDREAMAARRRALITRQQILPFLLKHLDPKVRTRAEVRAACALALAKVSHEPEAVELLLIHAEEQSEPQLVQESASLALGLLRRGNEERAMDGARLDAVRGRLLAIMSDERRATRTRAFAALSVGLLGDQPYGSSFSRHGRMTSQALWRGLQEKSCGREISVAMLTALGMQPHEGTSQEVKTALLRVANGRRVARRAWDDIERSHALTALVRQSAPAWQQALIRTIKNKRLTRQVQRAAFIGVGARSVDLTPAERTAAAQATLAALRFTPDPVTKGLAALALGRLLGADLASGSNAVLNRCAAAKYLEDETHHGSLPRRGFAAIGLALSIRGSTLETPKGKAYRSRAIDLLARGFERVGDPEVRSAYVVALGLLGPEANDQLAGLTTVVKDRGANAALRGHAALSLALIGGSNLDVRQALRQALGDKRSIDLRSQSALALSFLGGDSESTRLVAELEGARSQWVLAQVAAALGQLGDLSAVPGILNVARDKKREDEARALAIAALGLIGDPEQKPGMLLLTADSNYIAGTDALLEAFTIL